MKNSRRKAELIDKYIRKNIDKHEQDELNAWLNQSDDNKDVFNNCIDPKKQLSKLEIYQQFNKQKVWNTIEKSISTQPKVISLSQKLSRYAAVILLPLLIAGGAGWYFLHNPATEQSIATIDEIYKPGNNKAILVLSSGEEINLKPESMSIEDEGAVIENSDSTLQYTSKKRLFSKKELVYNELKTPKGGTYNLKLADGTEVWLNAGSSLRFPVEFTDSVRKVYLEGEGYFKVRHNGSPFVVSLKNSDVRVLGTSFNVNAYSDEQFETTTLVEGKVAIEFDAATAAEQGSVLLTPGLQSKVTKTSGEVDVSKVNTASYTSWVNGKIEFSNDNLEQVMKKLSRWYNFEYSFEKEESKDYHFTARFNREDNISDILKMLELTTNVSFRLEENKIVVL